MTQPQKLSIIAVFDDNHDVIESTLTALLELSEINYELVIVYDGTAEIGRETIQSLLEYYQHDNVFFYDHESPQGIGSSINEGIFNSDGSLVWVVRDIESVDEHKLGNLCSKLAESGAACSGMLPNQDADILSLLDDATPTKEQSFLWNREQLNDQAFFFSQHISDYHNTELFLRLIPDFYLPDSTPFAKPAGLYQPEKSVSIYQECIFAMLRSNRFNRSHKRNLMALLNEILFVEESDEDDTDETEAGSEQIENPEPETPKDPEPVAESPPKSPQVILAEAQTERRLGNFTKALSIVRAGLEQVPEHEELHRFQIELLERLGRYVEASELKHTHSKAPRPEIPDEQQPTDTEAITSRPADEEEKPQSDTSDDAESGIPEDRVKPQSTDVLEPHEIKVSVIIPTMGYGRHLLETSLASINEHFNPAHTELIIIDNISLDDTHEFLDDLKEINFFNIQLLTQQKNQGFAKSVNIGLEKARGLYALVMHNDVVVHADLGTRFMQRFEEDNTLGMIGPLTNRTMNPQQQHGKEGELEDVLEDAGYLDSFCFMIPVTGDLRMDESYGLAYFEDMDLSQQIADTDKRVIVDRSVFVEHFFAQTTGQLDLIPGGPRYYNNEWYYQDKWNEHVELPEQVFEEDNLTKLMYLEQVITPGHLTDQQKEWFDEWFTDEVKTVIMKETWEPEIYFALLRLLMKVNRRDVLRRLEDRMDDYELPDGLVFDFVSFYFENNIYSRCMFYIEKFTEPSDTRYLLYRLRIAWAEREMERIPTLIEHLFDRNPGNPDLLKLTGEIHADDGNTEEAQEFIQLAEQLDPVKFGRRSSEEVFNR